MKVLVTGATGFVGKRVVKQLLDKGDEVVVLTRNIAKGALCLGSKCKYFLWNDTTMAPPAEAFAGVDGVIHLMGEGIAEKRWSESQKKKIYDSRIITTSKIVEVIEGLEKKPSVFVSASGVGIYGNRGDEEVTEQSSLASDFLAQVCKDWEAEANKAKKLGLRVVIVRTGVVLGQDGGALKKMLPIFKLGAGGPVGSGKQYMSWIHVDDLAGMYVEAVKNNSLEGIFNGTAPYPATSKEFARQLGKTLGRPAFAPAPAPALKLVFGEMSQILLEGQKVLPVKFKENKFRFRFPTLEMALKESTRQ
jgi:uncharacterized protein (TIGR01777 family)